jgi:hypothetical protein
MAAQITCTLDQNKLTLPVPPSSANCTPSLSSMKARSQRSAVRQNLSIHFFAAESSVCHLRASSRDCFKGLTVGAWSSSSSIRSEV